MVQREVVAPILAGRALATVARTEPGGRSALEIRTTAARSGGEVTVNGSKVFNSNGPHATHFVVWCRFGSGDDEYGAVVATADADGVELGPTERFLSGEAHCAIAFDGCSLDDAFVLL